MAGDGWIPFAIMALAVGLANTLTFIAASNTNIPYMENMLGAFAHFVDVPPPIPTADEKILLELYLLSLVKGNASSGQIPPAGVHHPPSANDTSAGGLNPLLVLYHLALALLVLYPLFYLFVRGLVQKRAKAKADSEERDFARLLQREKVVNDGLTREKNELKRSLSAQGAITRADNEKLESLNKENANLFGELKRTETQLEEANALSTGSDERVRNLVEEIDSLKTSLYSKEAQTQATETRLNEVEESKTDLETELEETKRALVEADTLKYKSEDDRDKEVADLKRELQEAKTRSQEAENSKITAVETLSKEKSDLKLQLELAMNKRAEESKSEIKELGPLSQENTDFKTKLEGVTTKLQRAEDLKSEQEKSLIRVNTSPKGLGPLDKENVDLKKKLEGATTNLQRAEESKSGLEKKLAQANIDLKDLELLTKENIDLKTKLECSTDTLQLAEKSKSELKNSNQTNDGLREQLRKAKVVLKQTEESKTTELDLRAMENVNLRDEIQELKNEREQREAEDSRRGKAAGKAVELLDREKTDLENELQKARTTLEEAEMSKSESEASLNKVNTDLKTELQKVRVMLKEEEESKARAVEDMAKNNTYLTNQMRRSEDERKQQEFGDAKAELENVKGKIGLNSELQGMEGEGKQASNDVEAEMKNPEDKLADQDEQKKGPKMWDEENDKLKRHNEDVTKRIKEGKPNQDDQELQGTIDATPEPHSGPFQDALSLTPDIAPPSGNIGPESLVVLTPAKSGHSTSNISLQTLAANTQSFSPTTPNNRVDMPPSAGKLDLLDAKVALPTAPKPITSADPLGLSMANSSYASPYNTSRAPVVRNSTGSPMDSNNFDVEKAEKEKSRRSSEDIRSKLPPASSTGSASNANDETRSRIGAKHSLEGSAPDNLHAMRSGNDYRVPTGRNEKVNRGNKNYNQNKRWQNTATPSQPRRKDARSWSKDESPSSVLKKDDPSSGKTEVNALNNPTIQTSYFIRPPTQPENDLKEEHITFIQTLKKEGLKNDEIEAKTEEAFPLLYKGRGVGRARPDAESRGKLISGAVGMHTSIHAKWNV